MEITNPLILLILSLLGATIPLLMPDKLKATGAWISVGMQFIALIISILICKLIWSQTLAISYNWIEIGASQIDFSIYLDRISAMLLVVVFFVSFLVQLYSMEYMKEDAGFRRYFALLSFFTFSMVGIVISNNLLIMFMFWELVGFSSYLLIGFWYNKNSAAVAAKKAFVINRIGDAGFIIALSLCWYYFESFEIDSIKLFLSNSGFTLPTATLTLIGFTFFLGAMGKSAQFPLQVWLPDAMEGPTPVSALIHAATMVAAGVYLMVRLFFLLTPDALLFIGLIGGVTAFVGAVAALYQNDIKKVLAFSTISQLGYMMVGIGTGSYEAATFHLFTHAFFKAGLFLGAGSIIHSIHQSTSNHDLDAQDMRNMGGLKTKMPVTFWTYTIFSLSLIGVPLFSGFLSKEAILNSALSSSIANGSVHWLITFLVFGTVALTAFYVIRMIILTFYGNSRGIDINLIKESSIHFKLVLTLLAFGSIFFVWSINPFSPDQGWVLNSINSELVIEHTNFWIPLLSLILIIAGAALAYFKYKSINDQNDNSFIVKLSQNSWYLDRIYLFAIVQPTIWISDFSANFEQKVIDRFINLAGIGTVILAHITAWFDRAFIDGAVNFSAYLAGRTGALTRSVHGGKIQTYILLAIIGLLIIIILAL